MVRPSLSIALSLCAVASAPALQAQSNVRPGTDISLSSLGGIDDFGRSGTYPNGLNGCGLTTTACNVGTYLTPWRAPMDEDHPMIAFHVVRIENDRLEQISTYGGVKHGFASTNSPGCPVTGTCQNPGTGSIIGINCSDTYGAGLNSDNFWLGPSEEVNAFLGTWTARGSLLDRGFPTVSGGAANDGLRSLTRLMADSMGPIGNRMALRDADLGHAGATYYYAGYYVVRGEPEANRGNNLAHRRISTSWSGSSWNFSHTDSNHHYDSTLNRWSGALVTSNANGGEDGRFYVAVKVTGPVQGRYHYEYAVHNRDNHRGGASLRIPICTSSQVWNPSFRDIDADPNNDWVFSRTATELEFRATSLKQRWNSIYNFAFDSDAAPMSTNLSIDQYDAGAGAPWISVASMGPSDARSIDLGAGCGTPGVPLLTTSGNPPVAQIGNASFGLSLSQVAAGSTNLFLISNLDASLPLGNGCTLFADLSTLLVAPQVTANGSGSASLALPIPADGTLDGGRFTVQAAEVDFVQGLALQAFDLSNGLTIKLGVLGQGCQ
ncbi:MAG: hypothetical protein IPN34_21905 [Planctomycetes bacterium]|nr:hypothetical protein [Planctomycetota bacterium]